MLRSPRKKEPPKKPTPNRTGHSFKQQNDGSVEKWTISIGDWSTYCSQIFPHISRETPSNLRFLALEETVGLQRNVFSITATMKSCTLWREVPLQGMGVKWWVTFSALKRVGESWTNERWPEWVSFGQSWICFFLKGSRISVEKILFVCLFSFLDIFSELIWKHLLTVLFLLVQWVWYMQNESV